MNDIQKNEQAGIVQLNPNQLVQVALEQGADLDKLEKLMDLQQRWNKEQALKSFNVAMSMFKKDVPEITRNAIAR